MSNDDGKDFDSIFASKGNHASIYINATSQVASVAVINSFFYFQLTLLTYGYRSLLHMRNRVKRKYEEWSEEEMGMKHSKDDTMFRCQFRMCREVFYVLEKMSMDHKERQGYDMESH